MSRDEEATGGGARTWRSRRTSAGRGVRYGAEVRRLREERGLALTAAAAALGISSSYLSELETGRRPPPARDCDVALVRELGADEERLEVLRALDTGEAGVTGLPRRDVQRVVRLVRRLRERRVACDAGISPAPPPVRGEDAEPAPGRGGSGR